MQARPHGTYSIVAFDPETGEAGAAVQSHWFSVGSLCTWARPGVGAVATQSVVEPAHGPNILDRLEAGATAADALGAALAADALARVRQVAVADTRGGIAVHTGPDCIPEAGDSTGAQHSCQANMMGRATVPAAMSAAFTRAQGDLAERLMTALEGAEAEGGDVRGRQSAAIVVAPAAGEPWQLRGLSPPARALLRVVGGSKEAVRCSGKAAKELEVRLLAHAAQVHTESGRHETALEPWPVWRRRARVRALRSPALGRRQLESAARAIDAPVSALPWPAAAEST
jgi:hypothetical protein